MQKSLLERQSRLIAYLTSAAAIFDGGGQQADCALLQGLDRRLLGIEARFSFEKRMEKIAAVFPRTFKLMGSAREGLVRDFVDACPPCDIGRLENARQFHDFLTVRWRDEALEPLFLADVAACELAFAAVHRAAEDEEQAQPDDDPRSERPAQVRRSRSVVLLRCAHDIRAFLEGTSTNQPPAARDVPVAVVGQETAERPQIYELVPAIFELLSSLDNWVDQAAFGDSEDAVDLITELSAASLIETRR